MRAPDIAFFGLVLVGCGSGSGPASVTTQIDSILPGEGWVAYPPPNVPPPPVLPPDVTADAGDAAKD